MLLTDKLLGLASHVQTLPLVKRWSPTGTVQPSTEALTAYATCQDLAAQAVREVAGMISEGWTERKAAELLNTYLQDQGVQHFFHKAFVWFGDRTRYRSVKYYHDYLPTNRHLLADDVFILDVAPIYEGVICDIGYTGCLAPSPKLDEALGFLRELRRQIPELVMTHKRGGHIWTAIDQQLTAAGYDNIHQCYPFGVLGHRVHAVPRELSDISFINFGLASYWEFLSRGLFGQLLNRHYEGDLNGIWAIEPHIGGADFGAKFEEILIVTEEKAYWLDAKEFGPCL